MLLPVVCPLLITAGHCAEFVYKESEDLADLQAITPPSEQHHRLHLCYWFVSKKPHNRLRKLSKSTLSTGSYPAVFSTYTGYSVNLRTLA